VLPGAGRQGCGHCSILSSWGGEDPAAGVLDALVGLRRPSLCLESFAHRYTETTVAATALPLPPGGFLQYRCA